MSNSVNGKQQRVGNDVKRNRAAIASSVRETERKVPGTRLGGMPDWREGSKNSGKASDRHGQAIRDGK
jgi:hypothetical protein